MPMLLDQPTNLHRSLKDRGHFSQKNTPNLPFLAQEAQIIFFTLLHFQP
jgi:hypothetical protein